MKPNAWAWLLIAAIAASCQDSPASKKSSSPPLTLKEIAALVEDIDGVSVKGWDQGVAVDRSFAPPKDLKAFIQGTPLLRPPRSHGIDSGEFPWVVSFRKGGKDAAVLRFHRPGYVVWYAGGRKLDAILDEHGEEYISGWLDRLGIPGPERERREDIKFQAEQKAMHDKMLAEFPPAARTAWETPIARKDLRVLEGEPRDFDERVAAICEAICDPQKAARCVFRAGGVVPRPWNLIDNYATVFEKIVSRATPAQLLAALESCRDDHVALLGAAKMLLNNSTDNAILDRLPASKRDDWAARVYAAVVEQGTDGVCRRATRAIALAGAREAIPSVRVLFSGRRVPSPDPAAPHFPGDESRKEDPSIVGVTAYALGMLGDQASVEDLRRVRADAKSGPDRAATEIGLFMLTGEPGLGPRHFASESYTLADMAVHASERAGGRRGLDLLAEHGVATTCRMCREGHEAMARELRREAPGLADEFDAIKDWDRIPAWWKVVRNKAPEQGRRSQDPRG